MSQDIYIHGADPDEQDRLALMNRLINQACIRELALVGDERVLEVGAGTGAFAEDLAKALGKDGLVLAIERDAQQFAALAKRSGARIQARQGDVYDPPLAAHEWGRFDLVHARFLLEHLAEPERAVGVIAKALSPSGRLVLVDDDHSLMRMTPDPGGMRELWKDYYEHYRAIGNDPEVGTRLVSIVVAAGLQPVRTTQINYGACAGEPAFAGLADNLARVVGTASEALIDNCSWTQTRIDEVQRNYATWCGRPDATIWYALPCVTARGV